MLRSTSFFRGEPEGDRPALFAEDLDADEEALEYKLGSNMDAVLERTPAEEVEVDADGFRCCDGGGGGIELAGGLDARAARVDAAACDAGLC